MSTTKKTRTKYDGENGEAKRWIRVLKEELQDVTSPGAWLEAADSRLSGEAAKWANKTPTIRNMLKDSYIDNATNEDIRKFKELIISRFDPDDPDEEVDSMPMLQSLAQKSDEEIMEYYRRTKDLLLAVGGRDRKNQNDELSPLERSVLDLTIDRYINGLKDPDLSIRLLRYTADPSRSLRGATNLAQAEARQLKAEEQRANQLREKREFELLKDLRDNLIRSNGITKSNTQTVQSILTQLHQMSPDIPIGIDIKHGNYVPSINSGDRVTDVTYTSQDARVLKPTSNNRQNRLGGRGQIQSQAHVVFPPSPEYALPPLPAATKIPEANPPPALPPSSLPPPSIRNPGQRNFGNYGLDPNYDPKTSSNPYVNGKTTHTVTFRNPICFNCGTPGHKSFECDKAPLSRNEKEVIKNLYGSGPDKGSTRESNLAILGADDPGDEFFSIRDLYDEVYTPPETEGTSSTPSSHNPAYMSGGLGCNSLTLEVGDVSLEALAGESLKRPRISVEDIVNPTQENPTTNRKTKTPVKRVGKKKELAKIAGLIGQPPPDFKDLWMNTKVVLPALFLWQISPLCRDGRPARLPRTELAGSEDPTAWSSISRPTMNILLRKA